MDELPLVEIKKKKYSSRQGKNSKKALRRLDTHELCKEENPKKKCNASKTKLSNESIESESSVGRTGQTHYCEFPRTFDDSRNQQIENEIVEHEIQPELLSIFEEYEVSQIPENLRTAPTSAAAAAAKYKAEETKWKERERKQDELFFLDRESNRNKVIANISELFKGKCTNCRNCEGSVLCHTCYSLLCHECDAGFHFNHITHDRVIIQDEVLRKLKSVEFISHLGKVEKRDVPVRIFEPRSCPCCFKISTMRIQCGPDNLSVVTTKGREDGFSSPEFKCESCNFIKKPIVSDYMAADYWPGSLPTISSVVHGSALKQWQLLMFEAPGTSQGKCIAVYDNIAYSYDLDTKINRTHFSRASNEYRFFHYKIERETLHRHGRCKACGSNPHGFHCDGNRKCYRLQSAKDRDGESLYGNDIIVSDEDQISHTLKLEAKLGKPSSETCGGSNFQALRSENFKAKNLDITGIVMMTCTHGATVGITRMKRGESFSLTHMMHLKATEMGVRFFCSDVVCKYSKWAVKVAARFPEYKPLLGVKWFLSRFHGLVHSFRCRVLFNGHWNEGAGDFIGEEGEQAFSIYSRFANSLKHTSSFMFNDNLSSLSFARNVDVERRMVDSLIKWLNTARKNSVLYDTELNKLLVQKGLTVGQLPDIAQKLKQEASIMDGRNLSKNWSTGELEKELEGECFMMKVLKARVAKFSDTSKARSVEHHKMSQKKLRIDKIVERLKEKGVLVTPKHLEEGTFPWHKIGSVPLIEFYSVLDAYHLSLRYKEAIYQNQNEMIMFVREWQNIRQTLLSDIARYQLTESALNRSKMILARTEIVRVDNIIKIATKRFGDCLSAEELAHSPFSQGDDYPDERTEQEDDLLDGLLCSENYEELDLEEMASANYEEPDIEDEEISEKEDLNSETPDDTFYAYLDAMKTAT